MTFEGHDIHAEYASLRSRIGMVPQDDVVHGQLTVNQALMYAAELRLPPDTTKDDRAQVVAQVLEELEMTKHADTRVDKLSGGQRKRASVALELLTGPSLLILDEPTSGLDPALDRQVMTMLRQLADAGRVVLVVTHSLTYLDVCDQVLLLAPGGKTAFCGPPSQIGAAMGTTNWADIFSTVAADPDEANRRVPGRRPGRRRPHRRPQKPADLGEPAHTSLRRQFSTIARRQIRLIVSDRGYFVVPGAAAVHHGRAVAVGARQRRLRHRRPDGRRAQRAGPDPGAAQRRRGLHGHRADHPRPDRRARRSSCANRRSACRPRPTCWPRSACSTVVRGRAVGDRDRHRGARQGRARRRAPCVLGKPTLELFVDVAADVRRRRRCWAWRCRRWPSPTSRSCRCWWWRSCRSWCSPAA